MVNKVLSMLGLATKAGKVMSGEFSVEKSVKTGKANLVIVAEDASDNTKKLFTNMCTFYNIPLYLYGTKEILGHAIGKMSRASISVLDNGFSKVIMNELEIQNKNN